MDELVKVEKTFSVKNKKELVEKYDIKTEVATVNEQTFLTGFLKIDLSGDENKITLTANYKTEGNAQFVLEHMENWIKRQESA